MSLILDAGALVAVERADVLATTLISDELAESRIPISHGGVIGQVWRGGAGRQARLARLLPAIRIAPLDEDLGRRAGFLLARTRTGDVIAAAVILLASDGDMILTSDPHDLQVLASAAGVHVELVPV